jgi:sn-glycerol 3-phosphate transport system substrate-binding protein
MKRRMMLAGVAAVAAAPGLVSAQGTRTRVVFWHAMNGVLGDEVNRLCTGFNASQGVFEVVPIFKGTYPETLTAAIAAWRANQAPHLVQMFEVGTGSMLAAGPAVKQTWQLIQESGVAIDPAAYIGAVKGYYSLPDGRLASMPFNSSTPVMWYSRDAFEKAGLNPDAPPATWPEVVSVLQTIKSKGVAPTPSTSAWFSWVQFECFGAIHDVPFATLANGFEGLGTELKINSAPFVGQLNRFLELSKEGLFKYAGRDGAPDPLFYSGEAAVSFMSSGSRGDVVKNAKFKWAEAALPYDPALTKDPLNSVIGGASLWTMTAQGRTADEYKGVAEFLKYIAEPANVSSWHQRTGYVPVTYAGYELSKSEGFYEKNPGADVPIKQLARGHVTANSRGFRLGRMPEIRNIIYEETEKALQGQQTAQAAMDSAVARGNKVLREFERANKA